MGEEMADRGVEYRGWSPEQSEVRAIDGDGMSFSGYAAVFDSRSEDMGFVETVAPGAFDRTLRSRNEVKGFVNHNLDMPIGSTRAKTMRLSVDERGLFAEIDLPDTTYGRDLSVSVARGDVSTMSFGFSTVRDEWNEDYSERRLIEVRLHEVSVVSGFAAYSKTTASVRSLQHLAHRAHLPAEDLADALTVLQSGGALEDRQADMLLDVIDQARKAAPVDPDAVRTLLEMKAALMRRAID